MLDEGPSDELRLYYSRVHWIVSRVMGMEYVRIIEQLQRGSDSDESELDLYGRAFELFTAGYERFMQDQSQYEKLYEDNPYGQGPPNLGEALYAEFEFEACFLDDYLMLLGKLADKYQSSGDDASARECRERRRRVVEFGEKVRDLG